jgi:hypothetical protein
MTLQLVILYRKYCCAFQPLEKGRNQQFSEEFLEVNIGEISLAKDFI